MLATWYCGVFVESADAVRLFTFGFRVLSVRAALMISFRLWHFPYRLSHLAELNFAIECSYRVTTEKRGLHPFALAPLGRSGLPLAREVLFAAPPLSVVCSV